jgi:hemerythrin-like domain-containing protein
MTLITHYLSGDHKQCDDLCAALENFVVAGDWPAAGAFFASFQKALELHFLKEEEILFVALENAARGAPSPTELMRNEHRQIRAILMMLENALARKSLNAFLGHAETLNIMMQQHNMKEESALYLMIDGTLKGEQETILAAMRRLGEHE